MKIDINKKMSPRQMVDMFLLVAIPIICVGGLSFFPNHMRTPLIYAVAVVAVVFAVLTNINLRLNTVTFLYFSFLVYLAISLIYSYDRDVTLNFLLIYACVFPLLFIDLSENLCEKIMSVISVVAVVFAVSIIISVPIENCMDRFFWFIVNPTRSAYVSRVLMEENGYGIYTGFAREASIAAFIMNMGIAVQMSKYFSKGKLDTKEIICLGLIVAGLLITGKRMMLIIVTLVFCALMLISNIRGKAGRFILIGLIGAFSLVMMLMFIPQIANTLLRFTDTESLESFGSRDILWEYSYLMIARHWLFGAGFGSYNTFAYENGMTAGGGKWAFHNHNIYYQTLGEIGIVGCVLLFGFFIVTLVKTVILIRSKTLTVTQNKILCFSFYIQLMLLIYGITGNPLYTTEIIYTWIFSIAIYLSVSSRIQGKRKKEYGYKRRANV